MTHSTTLQRRQLLMAGVALSCGPLAYAADTTASNTQVMASFSIIADMARELAPPGVQVGSLVGPDADAHVYKPSPGDARRLAQARLVLVNGLGFEGWMDRLIKVSGHAAPPVVVSQDIQVRRAASSHGHGHHHHHGAQDVDPHAWHSPAHARVYVNNIAAALAERWPEHREQVEQRRQNYLQRLDALDTRLREQMQAVPRAQRRVLVSHDAFAYLGEAFGIDFVAPKGWTTASEPSAAAVGRLIREVRDQQVRALFVENISDPRLVERIARESGAQVGGVLYSDALSRTGGPADTYLRLLEHNVGTLAKSLGAVR
jgi:zinc/manganese transport system substrate-binding protein